MKAGDAVIVRTSWMSSRNGESHTIKNITKSGKIRLSNGILFQRNVVRWERGWGRMWLEEARP